MINNVNIRSCTHSMKTNYFFGYLLRSLDLFYFLFKREQFYIFIILFFLFHDFLKFAKSYASLGISLCLFRHRFMPLLA